MNILVTGGTGYIGEYFIPELLKQGHNVRLLVRNLEKGTKLFGNQCEYFIGDVTDKNSLDGSCYGMDVVFHMVAKSGNELPNDESFAAFRTINVEGTRNMIKESQKSGIKKFIFVSSIAAMGIVKETPITEHSQCKPFLPYQVSKYEAERLLSQEYQENKFPFICVRPTKVYGIGEHEFSYLTLAKLCKKGIFPRVGKGKNYTSNIYISDFVQALVKLVDKGVIGSTYILSSEGSIAMSEVGKLISETIGKKPVVIPIPAFLMICLAAVEETIFIKIGKKPIVTKKNIEATLSNRIYDLSKAKKEIGYEPKVSLEEGIVKTVKWYMENQLI